MGSFWDKLLSSDVTPSNLIAFSTVVGFAVVYYIFRKRSGSDSSSITQSDLDKLLQQRQIINSANIRKISTSQDTNFVEKMKRTGKNIVFFYGSQTGTAEEFATRLAKSAQKYGMKGIAYDTENVEDWDILGDLSSEIERGFAVFCMATYGEGEPTDNAVQFHAWLKEADISLSGLKFCVFALGNRTYEHFNAMGKFVDDHLVKLGGEKLCEMGMGDDDQNIEDDFVQWQENVFWPAICKNFNIESTGEFSSVRQFKLGDVTEKSKMFVGEPLRYQSFERQRPPFDPKNPFLANLITERKLNSGDDRYFMHIELDMTGSKLRYDSGDHVAVLPVNQESIVSKLAGLVGIDNLDDVINLENVDPDDSKRSPFPCPTTYRVAFSHYLDITSHPTTHLCRELAEYAGEEGEKDFLMLLSSSSAEGKDKYKEWIKNDNRTIVEVLDDLKSVKIPADHLCELLPRLQVRYYSISSSSKVFPTHVHVTAVLVDYKTPLGREVKGVCTQYLLDKAAEKDSTAESQPKKLACFIRKSQFRLPMKSSVPIIMIGPGTGFAPFRGFLQEKQWQKEQNKPLGEVVLYYGCRREATDFIYREEVENWVEQGVITNLYTAFSRDQGSKIYVQNKLAENGEETWKLLARGAHVYICGDAKNMARDVYACFENIIAKNGNMTAEQATQYLKNMSVKGRYSADVWS